VRDCERVVRESDGERERERDGERVVRERDGERERERDGERVVGESDGERAALGEMDTLDELTSRSLLHHSHGLIRRLDRERERERRVGRVCSPVWTARRTPRSRSR
jgi:hypothetical protein